MGRAQPAPQPQEECCHICNRVKWGQVVPLGFGRWRHTECTIGSEAWKEFYLALSPVEQEPLKEFFNFYYPVVEVIHAPITKGETHETPPHSKYRKSRL